MKVAIEVIEYLTKYTGIPIPLPKMDLLCVPGFDFGAMENWGLIIFRIRCLLCKEEDSSLSQKVYVASMIAHELVHK